MDEFVMVDDKPSRWDWIIGMVVGIILLVGAVAGGINMWSKFFPPVLQWEVYECFSFEAIGKLDGELVNIGGSLWYTEGALNNLVSKDFLIEMAGGNPADFEEIPICIRHPEQGDFELLLD